MSCAACACARETDLTTKMHPGREGEEIDGARAPRQARGHARRQEILDAVAAIIVESGMEGVTMQAVARRAGASIGSMYHFFRDRDQLFEALALRHADALNAVIDENQRRPDAEWVAMTPRQVVDQLFGRLFAYYERHGDALALLHFQESAKAQAFRETLERVLRHRLGEASARSAAATLYGVSTGSLIFATTGMSSLRDDVIHAIPQVLTAYLSVLEAKRADPPSSRPEPGQD